MSTKKKSIAIDDQGFINFYILAANVIHFIKKSNCYTGDTVIQVLVQVLKNNYEKALPFYDSLKDKIPLCECEIITSLKRTGG